MRPALIIVQTLVILSLGYWAYVPALRGEWLFDDVNAILENPVMHRASGLWTIWFAPPGPDYFPLKDSVQWLQWQLFGATTHGYHVTNLALHLVTALLVWRLLAELEVRLAWVGGLVFAIHPCTVESVAWICELKNTLSLPLLMVAMLAYIRHDRDGNRVAYLAAITSFFASLLAKTSGVMFPAIILLYAWWRHGGIRAVDWKKSAPFFAISLALGLATIAFQHHVPPGGEAIESLDPLSRLLCAGLDIAFYIAKFFLPIQLNIVYFRWDVHALISWELFCWLLIATSLVWLATRHATWARHILFGYLFLLINLLPVLGFVRMTWTRYAWVADHFLYLPMIGLIGIVVGAVGEAYNAHRKERFFISAAVAIFTLFLTVQARDHCSSFARSSDLWATNLDLNPQSWLGRNNLAVALAANGDPEGAIRQIKLSLQTHPDQALGYINWGNALVQMGHLPEAIEVYRMGLALRPDNPLAHYEAGHALAQEEHWNEAIEQFRLALRYNPADTMAHCDLAAVLLQTGQIREAIEEGQKAVALDPEYSDARYNFGIALGQAGRLFEAIVQFEAATRLNPTDVQSQYNLGVAYLQAGRNDDAKKQFMKVFRMNSRYMPARDQLLQMQKRGL